MADLISIDANGVISAVLVVAIMLVIISVPSILISVRHSSKMLKKYRLLRSIDDISEHENVPENILNEWNSVKSQMAYTTLISEEIEKLSGLRPAFFQAELAAILIIVLAIVPGFSGEILWIMIVIAVISFLAVVYASMNTRNYTHEYLTILKEMNENKKESDNGAADGMYG